MPASLFGDMDHHGGGGLSLQLHHHPSGTPNNSSSANTSCSSGNGGGSLIDDDQRALQLALELSMLGLTDNTAALQLAASVAENHHHNVHHQQQQHHHQQQQQNHFNQHHQQQQQQHNMHHHHNQQNSPSDIYSNNPSDMLPKKSQNMTECVPVPSSEHVAEIVGRQGCKIKALRAKTNTYIKTPVRGEEPVFVVTGRKEDVAAAKREILSAAEHFSQIRASRKGGAGNGPSAPAPVPGQITIQVRVPYRVVGLVVGPKGATIKRIQQQTHTYIVTPSREKDPVFEVTGQPDNVQVAKREIEAHIAIRTGSFPMDQNQMMGENELTNPAEILANLYKNGIGSLGLEGLGLGLGAINSLSSSLSSVSNLGIGAALAQNGVGNNSVGSSSSGGGSLSSLSSLNGFSANPMAKLHGGNIGTQVQQSNDSGFYGHPALTDLGFSLMDNSNTQQQQNGFMSSSRSEDSYLFGGSGPNSIDDGSQSKLTDLFAANNSVGSSLWGSFDRDEGLGESPTLESAPGGNSNLISLQ